MSKNIKGILTISVFLIIIAYITASGRNSISAAAKTLSSIKDDELLFLIEKAPTQDEVVDDAAVFLLHEQKNKFDEKSANSSVRNIIKILDEGAVEEFGLWQHLYNSDDVKVNIDIARTIDEDGTVHDVPKDMIRRVRIFPDYSEYSNITKILVTFPSLKKNSIIDIKFTTEETPSENWSAFGSTTYTLPLGYDIMKVKLEIDWPRKEEAKYYYKGFTENEIKIIEKGDRKKLILNTNNYQIYHANEPFRPPYKEIAPYVLFSTQRSWDELCRIDKEDFFDVLISDDKVISQKAVQIIKDAGAKTQEEKIKALYHFITQEIRYIDLSFMSVPQFSSNKADLVLKNKYADCKGMTSLFISLLNAVDISAYFALVPTYWFGDTDKEVPLNYQFNHVITAIPQGTGYLFLDPTASFSRYPFLPGVDQDILAVLLKEEGCHFQRTPLLPPEDNTTDITVTMQVEGNGGVKGTITEVLSGGDEPGVRGKYEKTSWNNLKKDIEGYLSSSVAGIIVEDFEYTDPRDTSSPFALKIDYSIAKYTQKIDDLLIVSIPPIGSLINTVMYNAHRREYSFYMQFLFNNTREIIIDVPVGYKVKKIPESFEVDTAYYYVKYGYVQKGEKLIAKEEFTIKKREIPADIYQEFKSACIKCTSLLRKDVVFQKKK